MASIYLHFPFCKSRCIYCDFFSTTSLELRRTYVEAMKRELSMRCDEWSGEPIRSVYLGGGTPSQMSVADLSEVLSQVYRLFNVDSDAEVTMECNPDDLNDEYVRSLRLSLPVNRLSLGVQTFDDSRLQFLRRRHNASGALSAVARCREAGYGNLSIDLIYGFPGQSLSDWCSDLDQALDLEVEHLSAYSLMYEEGTALFRMFEQGAVHEVDEEVSLQMYQLLVDRMSGHGYRHYEISNFCKPGYHSRHNSGYWNGTHYLGVGAGAHSYDGSSRSWNKSSLAGYIDGVLKGVGEYREVELLDESTRFNEMVMTALRTSAGVNLTEIECRFGRSRKENLLSSASRYLSAGMLERGPYIAIDSMEPTQDEALRLTRDGVFVSNGIIADLFL